jgi:signal transduction histidine kinase
MGGTGLGLAIAKWAVEANGGQITLDNTERGSTFRIVLPRTR